MNFYSFKKIFKYLFYFQCLEGFFWFLIQTQVTCEFVCPYFFLSPSPPVRMFVNNESISYYIEG
jgi:hypothetical protein